MIAADNKRYYLGEESGNCIIRKIRRHRVERIELQEMLSRRSILLLQRLAMSLTCIRKIFTVSVRQ